MNNQYNSTGAFGIDRYGPASGPQHVASISQHGGDGEEDIMGGQRQSQRQNRRSQRNRSQRRNKSYRGGKKQQRNNKSRRNKSQRRSQRGGK
jgi:hypothetical protein